MQKDSQQENAFWNVHKIFIHYLQHYSGFMKTPFKSTNIFEPKHRTVCMRSVRRYKIVLVGPFHCMHILEPYQKRPFRSRTKLFYEHSHNILYEWLLLMWSWIYSSLSINQQHFGLIFMWISFRHLQPIQLNLQIPRYLSIPVSS